MLRFDRIRSILKREEKEAEKFGNVEELDYITTLFEDLAEIEEYINTEKDRKKRRNKQIKDLKQKIENLLDTEMNAHGETLRVILDRQKEE